MDAIRGATAIDCRDEEKCAVFFSLAAIGALYHLDETGSSKLIQAAIDLTERSLDRHRQVRVSAVAKYNNCVGVSPAQSISLRLVQAMLFIVIYDQKFGNAATSSRAEAYRMTLSSLVWAAEATRPRANHPTLEISTIQDQCINLAQSKTERQDAVRCPPTYCGDYSEITWIEWKSAEERRRCFAAIYLFCALKNRSKLVDSSPVCSSGVSPESDDEVLLNLWAAKDVHEWHRLGGIGFLGS